MRITVLYNHATLVKKGRQEDLACEQEVLIITPIIADILRDFGHEVTITHASLELWNELRQKRDEIDLIFNLAEGFGGANSNELFVPAMLEALDIPFTGPGFRTFAFAYDKWKTAIILGTFGLRHPKAELFYPGNVIVSSSVVFPAIVKPVHEDASLGITYDSVVTNTADLVDRVQRVHRLYSQAALVEEFIAGREISVGCIGNGSNVHVFPPLEFVFGQTVPIEKRIRSYEYKWGGHKEAMKRAELGDREIEVFRNYTRIAFRVLDCREYARVDYRLTESGDVYLLEANCNPGIGPNNHGLNNTLTMMASFDGYTFEGFIAKILELARARYGF